ncbi:MAG: DUF4446 family protein [Patescibacteria group bacterium]
MLSPIFFVYIALGVIFAGEIALGVLFWLARGKIKLFFSQGGKNLEESLQNQLKTLAKQGQDIEQIFKEIQRLASISKISFQKTAVLRFNPFKEVGGNQSFCIALLDAENNGFVLTGLYERENCRVYTKPIEQGISKYQLSQEEVEAIAKAMNYA